MDEESNVKSPSNEQSPNLYIIHFEDFKLSKNTDSQLELFLNASTIDIIKESIAAGNKFVFLVQNEEEKSAVYKAKFGPVDAVNFEVIVIPSPGSAKSNANKLCCDALAKWPTFLNYCYYYNTMKPNFSVEILNALKGKQKNTHYDYRIDIQKNDFVEQIYSDIQIQQSQLTPREKSLYFESSRITAEFLLFEQSNSNIAKNIALSPNLKRLLLAIQGENQDVTLKILSEVKNSKEFRKHINDLISFPRHSPLIPETFLTVAISVGKNLVVEELVKCGANINQKYYQASPIQSPLALAATSGHLNILNLLCNHDADLTYGGHYIDHSTNEPVMKFSPYLTALESGQVEAAMYLETRGAKVIDPNSPAWQILVNHHTNGIQYAITHKLTVSSKSADTLYYLESKKQSLLKSRLELLPENLRKLFSITDPQSFIALSLVFLQDEKNCDLLKRYINQNNWAFGFATPYNYTLFYHFVSYSSSPELIQILISKCGADVNLKTIYEQTPLQLAVSSGNQDIINVLRINGASDAVNDHSDDENFNNIESEDESENNEGDDRNENSSEWANSEKFSTTMLWKSNDALFGDRGRTQQRPGNFPPSSNDSDSDNKEKRRSPSPSG